MATASRFKDTRQMCVLSVPAAGKLFRVSERTIRNWEAGRVGIPYAAFKLMRILRGYELPGAAWKGYRLIGDTLWSPEGKPFKAADARWWSLTVCMAHEFRRMVAAARTQGGQASGVAAAASPAVATVLVAEPAPVIPSNGASPATLPGPLPESKTLETSYRPPTTQGDTVSVPRDLQPRVVIRGALHLDLAA